MALCLSEVFKSSMLLLAIIWILLLFLLFTNSFMYYNLDTIAICVYV